MSDSLHPIEAMAFAHRPRVHSRRPGRVVIRCDVEPNTLLAIRRLLDGNASGQDKTVVESWLIQFLGDMKSRE